MGSRCGLCKNYRFDFEFGEEWCTIDSIYLDKEDCPNFEDDIWD